MFKRDLNIKIMNEDSYSEKLKNVGNGQSCKMLKC